MINLTKKFSFCSAHRMYNDVFSVEENNNNFGKCQNIHGHNYFIEITISGEIDKQKGYFVNLNEFAEKIQINLIQKLDHTYLNEIIPNSLSKPVTMEILASWIWQILNENLTEYNFTKIRLWETENNSVEIYK
ncbi:MAG: 6-carboxytetrahydropterin synthase [Candidatus Shapirobacteria bacterium]|nr:6-carboxytetrahydropterin synthase [Candidatus Shapirobacteria bacterium]